MTKTFKSYEVTIRPQFAAYNDKQTTVTVRATTKADAIKQARFNNRLLGYYDRFNGRISYTAQEVLGEPHCWVLSEEAGA